MENPHSLLPNLFPIGRRFSRRVKFGVPAVILVLLWLLWRQVPVLFTSLMVSWGLYYILNPFVNYLESRSVSRTAASLLALLGFMGIIGLVLFRAWDVRTTLSNESEMTAFYEKLDTAVESSIHWVVSKIPVRKKNLKSESAVPANGPKAVHVPSSKKAPAVKETAPESPKSKTAMEQFNSFVGEQMLKLMPDLARLVAELSFNLILIPYLTFFLLRDARSLKKTLIHWIPNKYFEAALKFFYEMNHRMQIYLQNLLLDCLLVGIVVTVGASLVGAKYPIILGVIAFFLNSIPLLGPLLTAIIFLVINIGLGAQPGVIWGLLGVCAVSRVCDDLIFQPLIYGKSHGFHPAVIICAILIGETLAGIWGMFLAIPVMSMILLGVNIVREMSVGEGSHSLPQSAKVPFA